MASIAKIEARVDKAVSELAVPRLKEEIVQMENQLVNYANKSTVGIVLMIVGGIVIFVGIFVNYGFALFGLLCVIIGIAVFRNGMKVTSEERKLEKVLKEKKAELKHHESILRQ
jgi:predicted membrane protein